jgi:uncharacterized membrane protein YphA (DoxX/SURF4 family)
MQRIRISALALVIITAIVVPFTASAHEVYVLTPQEIAQAVSRTSPNPFGAIPGQELLFLIWGTITAVAFLLTLTASVTPLFERVFDPFLYRLKKYAPFIGRLTFGISVLASGYFGDFFGPELPVTQVFSPGMAHAISIILMIAGVLICLGFMTRIMAFLGLCLFAVTVVAFHAYMLTYVNYLGEMLLFFILGGGKWSMDRAIPALASIENLFKPIAQVLERYSFLILRVLFGTAVFFASFYAKFLHSNLALDTVRDYSLTNYFHFTPLFLVLGAFIVEALLGLCFALGFEVRLAALVFTFFLTLSILFFGEAVWPHIILFGVNITLFFHGYDKYTLEKAIFERTRKGEPVL